MVLRVLAVVFCIAFAACSSEPTPPTPPTSHSHEAPHGGVLVELGEHFAQLEFVLDPQAGALTLFVLDGEAAQAVRIAQTTVTMRFDAPQALAGRTFELAAKANVLTGETVGDTSQFVVTHEALKNQALRAGRVVAITVKGQEFRDLPVTLTR